MGQEGNTSVLALITRVLKGGLRLVFFAVGAVVLAAFAFIGPKVWRLTNPPLTSNMFWIGGGYHESEAGRAERLERLEKRLARTSPNKSTEAGRSAMHFGAAWGDAATMAALVGAGGDVNAQSAQGETPLMEAARTGNLETFEALLAAGADIHAADAAGRSVLVHAINHAAREDDGAPNGSLQVARRLIEAGADPNHLDTRGWSALHYGAAGFVPSETVPMLIEAGADPSLTNSEGERAVDLLHFETSDALIKMLTPREGE